MSNLHIISKGSYSPALGGGTFEFSRYAVTLTILKPGSAKLNLVKAIKDITGYGLRESKDIVDSSINMPQVLKAMMSSDEIKRAKESLNNCVGLEYTMTDIQTIRNRKLIELGIADRNDLVDELVDQDINEIYLNKYDLEKIKELLTIRYRDIPEESIKNLLKIN